MPSVRLDMFSSQMVPTFSGHETFALRSNWLKKGYDILRQTPDLFSYDDAFVRLGVGKNMAQSIRFWGRVCGVFDRAASGDGYAPTNLGHALLSNEGWDPFLVTPASHWLLHWQIAARPEAAFTWFFSFNLLKGGEFTLPQLAQQIRSMATEHGWRVPSESTINRDIECMINCYCPTRSRQQTPAVEDVLLCPLTDLSLLQPLPGQALYRLVSGLQVNLPDALVAFAVFKMMHAAGRQTMAFSDLAYAPRSPGRVFRLNEDALLGRLQRIREITDGRAYYTDQAGIRQVAWTKLDDPTTGDFLLGQAFANEVRYA